MLRKACPFFCEFRLVRKMGIGKALEIGAVMRSEILLLVCQYEKNIRLHVCFSFGWCRGLGLPAQGPVRRAPPTP